MAYAYLYAVNLHMRHLYWTEGKQNLTERLGLVFDDSIRTQHMMLADELSTHYLPPTIIKYIHSLFDVYTTGVSGDAVLFQLTPWTSGYNNTSAFEAGYLTHIAALRGISNLDSLRGAFNSPFYRDARIKLEMLSFSEGFKNPDNFLATKPTPATFNEDMFNIWTNLPLEAFAVAVERIAVADRTTSIPLCYIGDGISKTSLRHLSKYITTDLRYQPGVLIPAKDPVAGGDNNLKYIDAAGQELEVDIRTAAGFQGLILGIQARLAENVYTRTTSTMGVVKPSGTSHVYTSMQSIGYDVYDLMTELFL
uniref:Capsid protein n=1 Tax=viral metagenome TaxID=1070528 RepID=A0A2V0RKJ4_9ZZZZ